MPPRGAGFPGRPPGGIGVSPVECYRKHKGGTHLDAAPGSRRQSINHQLSFVKSSAAPVQSTSPQSALR